MIKEPQLKNNSKRDWLRSLLNFALIAFFFLLPWQTRYIFRATPLYEWGTLSIYGVEILIWAMIILFLFRRPQKFPISNFSAQGGSASGGQFLIIGLILFSFSSIIWAPDKLIALQASARLMEGVLLFVILNNAPQPPLNLRGGAGGVIYAFLFGAVIQALLGAYQFFTQSSFASTFLGMALHDPRELGTVVVEFGQERWLRAYGSLPHPNVLGGYLAVALTVLIHENIKTLKHKNIGWWFALIVLLTGIFFSFSRAAWIAGVGVLGYWMISAIIAEYKTQRENKLPIGSLFYARWNIVVHTLLITCYIMFLVFLFRPLVFTRVAPVATERLEIKSRVERVEGLQESWELIKQHPILGVGVGNYTQGIQRDIRSGDPLYSYQPVHNVFLLILAEVGVVGLLLFILALYKIFRQSKPNALMLLCFIVLMIFDHYLWSLPFGILLFWGVLGLSTGYFNYGLDKKPLL